MVPFKDTADGSGVMTALRAVTSHYVVNLTGLLRNSKGLGGFRSTWSAYQAELALEEVFWGHPLCQEDRVYSVSLGTASTRDGQNDYFPGTSSFSSVHYSDLFV